ncbi:MAG: M23 family metallopeptidase [Defluviitaleaceae bacterium]|nr:M23 family metallopeptidase [Defluviitaleaceae bacterium]
MDKKRYRRKHRPGTSRRDIRRAEKMLINILAGILVLLTIIFARNILLPLPDEGIIPIENVAAFAISPQTFADLKSLSNRNNVNFVEVLTIFSLSENFFPPGSIMPTKEELENEFFRNYRNIKRSHSQDQINTYKKILGTLLNEIESFPIAQEYMTSGENGYYFSDTFGAARTYGGDRKHEGTDIMDRKNARGRIPVVSMTNGVIRNIGWGELGGYNIGINSASGNYYYYAHFDSFAPGLQQGDTVEPGQLLGFMGDSGYGSEGTRGMFAVHLHVGIKVNSDITENGMFWINPYVFLRNIEGYRD